MGSGERERDEDDHSKLLVTKIRESYDSPEFSDIIKCFMHTKSFSIQEQGDGESKKPPHPRLIRA